VYSNSALTLFNATNFTSTSLEIVTVRQNSLTSWTQNLPSTIVKFEAYSNKLPNFNVDFSTNINLEELYLQNNLMTGISNTISAATSLTILYLFNNKLLSLPPKLPPNVEIVRFDVNKITGYTSDFPSTIKTFFGNSLSSNQNVFNSWDVEISGATSLASFNLKLVELTGWTKYFPASNATVDLTYNRFTNIDLKYFSGASSIDFSRCLYLTGLTNMDLTCNITSLSFNSCGFTSQNNIIPNENFNSNLELIQLGGLNMTSFTKSFSAATGINTVTFQNTKLKKASVDFILHDLAVNNSVIGGKLYLDGISGFPESPTGGVLNPDYITLTSAPRNWVVLIN
jgi:hypothetical protein